MQFKIFDLKDSIRPVYAGDFFRVGPWVGKCVVNICGRWAVMKGTRGYH